MEELNCMVMDDVKVDLTTAVLNWIFRLCGRLNFCSCLGINVVCCSLLAMAVSDFRALEIFVPRNSRQTHMSQHVSSERPKLFETTTE